VASSFEHGNEILGSIKGGEFLVQLREYDHCKNDTASRISLIEFCLNLCLK